eukprot:TRINITY_DN3333_c0_g2_i1.p1 TRINITY_DN3333_c0_g2~~TRINITY_DN3333_c0_g2_i1.p1  ORF type:complete len:935 (+),score=174.23 TRINITY_DN3333_c0_g2_i1:137-2941(+)
MTPPLSAQRHSDGTPAAFLGISKETPMEEESPGMNEKTRLVQKIKELQRKDPNLKQQWTDYCDQHGHGRHDPILYETDFLRSFSATLDIPELVGQPPSQMQGEYRIYIQNILQPLRPAAFTARRAKAGGAAREGRALLEEALTQFVAQLRCYVTGCDDRKLSKGCLRRARCIELQLSSLCENVLAELVLTNVLAPEDLHGIWHGFAMVRGWRDGAVPQECLLQMLRGAFAVLDEDEVETWADQALTWELTLPEIHQAISVAAWPALCELFGRLPDCVTAAEIQEALWQQSFVENPTHAPSHRNYKRFAALASQMVAIGVELESDKVELLVQQTLELDRPWRERRDMMSGILSAASVEDRNRVVQRLDKRFEEHNDLDDFEIVCGISEAVGIEVPREGAIRRCALRRWALDEKRGGALPAAQLIDFVDCDPAIGEDVAVSLRQKGRTADAALLLAKLPPDDGPCTAAERMKGLLEVSNGDAELGRLREILAMDEDHLDGHGVFGPVEEGAFRVPYDRGTEVAYSRTAEEAEAAVDRLRGAPLLAISSWEEDAPFWHRPTSLLAFCSDECIELFDLPSLRNDISGGWPEASNKLRSLLSDPGTLKIYYGDDMLQMFAYTLGLGVASTLRRGDREPLGPSLDMSGIVAAMLGVEETNGANGRVAPEERLPWHTVITRFLGLRLCGEERGANWARRPLRESQLHHAAAEAWSQLPILRAICAYGLLPKDVARQFFCVHEKPQMQNVRAKLGKGHTLGQLAPAGRLINSDQPLLDVRATCGRTKVELAPATRIAVLDEDVPPGSWEFVRNADTTEQSRCLSAGTLVEVFDERFGGMASVAPIHDSTSPLWRVPSATLRVVNGWVECPHWVGKLPRPQAPVSKPTEVSRTPTGKRASRTTVAQDAVAIARAREEAAVSVFDSIYDPDLAALLLQRLYDYQ